MRQSICTYRVLSIAVAVIGVLAGNAFSATFTNASPIVIPGPGSSNGSSISVSGLGNSITSLVVGIDGFSHSDPHDVGLVLVGPTGAVLAIQGAAGGSTGVTALNLTFSDSAASQLPQNTVLTAGTYKPTQYASIGSFPSPGPGLAYKSPAPFGTSTLFQTFAPTNPNGTWSLYAMDPVSDDVGQISGGWNLQITATPEPASLSLIAIAGVHLACGRRRCVVRDIIP